MVTAIGPSTYLLKVTDETRDLAADYRAFDERRQAIVEHLGRDAFWDPGKGRMGPYRAPGFAA